MTQPAMFLAHGSPTLAIEDNNYTQFLKQLIQQLPRRPRAVVVFSAHFDSPVQAVSNDDIHETMHDFYGFPEEMYGIHYPAPGDRELSKQIGELFANNNLTYEMSSGRGLDHGVWVLLRMLFPEADVPVVELSVDSRRSPAEQYAIGKMLTRLRQENVLVLGSGGLVHNLRLLESGASSPADWAVEFDEWIGEQLQEWNLRILFDYERRAPHVRKAVPVYANEHFAPLLYAMGAADDERRAVKLFQDYQYGSISLNCWVFGGTISKKIE
ncbi:MULTISPECIES: DODA-type extradiol aromatic ring-opening family dioxygenase [unclassified Paenibacillus]|uniref:DODA-type extradiol aromatic ring-opening family dioxygenase n=1 Tax=unclassified Paenibacillus TaxID=185978 RepID=UPI0008387A3E|nr:MULTISPECIES: class III extradiol ring-cleavage dioxygenase [unclassified Paenibacillus]NWL89281.1 dioxygenase [Paenibacillus sp. 79R4]